MIMITNLFLMDQATFSSSTQALLDMNWINLSSRRSMQRCLFMHKLINDSERNSMITRGTDYHSHNTRSKENIRSIRSNTNWGLLRSFNSALTDWNSLPEDMRCLPYDALSRLHLIEETFCKILWNSWVEHDMESDEIDLSIVISTFDIGHVTKISLHCWKDQLKICGKWYLVKSQS